MRLGIAIYRNIGADTLHEVSAGIADAAKRIADSGFDSLWAADSIGRDLLVPDPFMLLGVAAGATQDIELGTCIVQVPLRETIELAHRVLSARLICGERLLFGVGYGSTRDDYNALGRNFDDRRAVFEQAMLKLRTLLETGRHKSHDLKPWPLAGQRVPLLLGTWGREVSTAATDYDGWIGSGFHRDDEQLSRALLRYREAGGNRAIVVIPDEDQLHKRVEGLQRAGYDDTVIFPADYTAKTLKKLRGFVA